MEKDDYYTHQHVSPSQVLHMAIDDLPDWLARDILTSVMRDESRLDDVEQVGKVWRRAAIPSWQ